MNEYEELLKREVKADELAQDFTENIMRNTRAFYYDESYALKYIIDDICRNYVKNLIMLNMRDKEYKHNGIDKDWIYQKTADFLKFFAEQNKINQ